MNTPTTAIRLDRAEKAAIQTDDTLDLLANAIRERNSADRTARWLVDLIAPQAEALANGCANGNAEAQAFVGRFNILREQVLTKETKMLDSRETATRLKLIKPDGKTPRDSFYKLRQRLGGVRIGRKWQFPEDRVEAYLRGRA